MTGANDLVDPEFLARQYRTEANLQARISLHRRFSTNSYGLHRWIFDRLRIPSAGRVLELGCGSGELWMENGGRIPGGWRIMLTDLSVGMARQAQSNLARSSGGFRFAAADAQCLPFGTGEFDAVIANHMFYHVPDRPRALGEIRRVLRPGGRLYASTVGIGHMRELAELVHGFDPALEVWGSGGIASEAFTLENGAAQISARFADVALHRYDDALVVTEPAPLIEYVLSGRTRLEGGRKADFAAYTERVLQRGGGSFRITKETGLFEAVRI